MLSPADMLIIGAVALIAFGPDQLPKVARKAGQVMRDVQNTSQGFIREMERVADDSATDHEVPHVPDSPMYGRMAEPSPAPEPFSMHDPFANGQGNVSASTPHASDHAVDAEIDESIHRDHEYDRDGTPEMPRRKFSASEST